MRLFAYCRKRISKAEIPAASLLSALIRAAHRKCQDYQHDPEREVMHRFRSEAGWSFIGRSPAEIVCFRNREHRNLNSANHNFAGAPTTEPA
jgi:hypothetical protein